MRNSISVRRQRGATMVEVLVSIAILTIGLLGLAGLQSRLQVSEMEAYQRAQALVLLNDMANRISTNRNDAESYQTATPLGAGEDCPAAGASRQEVDFNEWCMALKGAAEVSGGSNVGAMIGGRGCVENIADHEYMVTVAWQGLVPLSAPPASVSCGQGEYDTVSENASCKDDLCRRVVTTIVRIATLS